MTLIDSIHRHYVPSGRKRHSRKSVVRGFNCSNLVITSGTRWKDRWTALTLTTTCCPQTRPPPPPPPHPQSCGERTLPLFFSRPSSPPHITRIPLHLWAWGRGYLRPKASNMATESKGLHACCTAGCWHLLPPHPLPVSSSRPLAPPRSLKEIHCPCFLSCLPLPELGKQYSIKERKRTSCPFVRCVSQRCCLLHSTAWFLFYTHRLFLMEKK